MCVPLRECDEDHGPRCVADRHAGRERFAANAPPARPRPGAISARSHRDVSDVVRSRAPGRVRARPGAPALLLLSRGQARLHGGRGEGPRVRDGSLGCRDDLLPSAVGAAGLGRARGRDGGGGQSSGGQEAGGPGRRVHPRDRGVLRGARHADPGRRRGRAGAVVSRRACRGQQGTSVVLPARDGEIVARHPTTWRRGVLRSVPGGDGSGRRPKLGTKQSAALLEAWYAKQPQHPDSRTT